MNVQAKGQPIRVELGDQEAEGTYSNLAFVSHTASEFILDFARLLPGSPKARVHARVIMTPQSAKALQKSLEANVQRFEEVHGEIKLAGQTNATPNIGFHTN